MSQEGNRTGALIAAAEALESELGRYEQLASTLERERLDSEKNLRRAAQTLGTVGDIGARLGEYLAGLLSAIHDVRARQEALTATIQTNAERIRQRSQALSALLQRWATLGQHAAEVNRLAQQPPDQERDSNGSGAAFEELNGRLTQLADEAQLFAETAEAEQFADLARQAEGLRAQILSVRNKLRLARPTAS